MSLAWNAGWEQSLRGSNPLSSAIKISPPLRGEGLIFFSLGLNGSVPQRSEHSVGDEVVEPTHIHSPAQLDLDDTHPCPQL